jgi:hypothetical protein
MLFALLHLLDRKKNRTALARLSVGQRVGVITGRRRGSAGTITELRGDKVLVQASGSPQTYAVHVRSVWPADLPPGSATSARGVAIGFAKGIGAVVVLLTITGTLSTYVSEGLASAVGGVGMVALIIWGAVGLLRWSER